ncbi:DNA-methyltransferase [Spirabiliibacterium pneumoniae]|uniref:DNA-methyltransferase n=1 Tax=Spirabiliibacterium pneumoniae TaxID=221400 RepID=UPI001AAE069B|nr:site-specific DNA-methyltransferase [Spirabiliibacterium pneumoniae]
MKDIPGDSIDLVLTDPPYGTTACKWDSVIPFEPMWKELKRITKDNAAIILFGSQPFTSSLIMSNAKDFKYCWVWDKGRGVGFLNSKKQPLRQTEDVVVFYRKQPLYNPQMRAGFSPYKKKNNNNEVMSKLYSNHEARRSRSSNGYRYPVNIITFSKGNDRQHPTQKPVALLEYLIKTYTKEGETVLDFTMGSGSTGVACRRLNRDFIGIELDENYFNIAKQRIENEIV